MVTLVSVLLNSGIGIFVARETLSRKRRKVMVMTVTLMAVAVVMVVMMMVMVTVPTGSILISAHTIAVGVCLAFGAGRHFVARTG